MSRIATLILCHILANFTAMAQNTTLSGIVSDKYDPVGLVGVNIIIKGTTQGTVSGLHGDYLLKDIPAGKQIIQFIYLGYETYKFEFEAVEGEIHQQNISLIPGSIDLSSVTVVTRQPFSAASSKAIRDFDLKIKPVRSAQDMLQLAPGLIIAQHAGGGKAEQIFMRGFDADHGTDVGITVDGLPVNMVSHGHGQGYADLHFVIPEIIDGLIVSKGPYFSQHGNFSTAGSVAFTTTDHPDNNLVKLEGGMFNTAKVTTVLKIPTSGDHQSAYMAGQYYYSDGVLESPQHFNRMNLYGKFHTHLTAQSELGIGVGAFTSAWNASGQIPQRAVEGGLISRQGSIDDLEGGLTSRYNLSLDYHFMEGYDHDFMVQAYVSSYNFKLFSNFTFWLNDSIDGDMIEQTDYRTLYGINTRYSKRKSLGNIRTHSKVGGSYRGDHIDLGLWKSPQRIRKSVRRDDAVHEINMAFWIEEDLVFSRFFKMQLGLRGDYFTFDVTDHLDQPNFAGNGLPHASGYSQASILSPKINLVLSPTQHVDIFLNSGTGFHSNDAREVVMRHVSVIKTLPRAIGSEVGIHIKMGKNIFASLAGWYLHMEEELVYIGDEGGTEISAETRRVGIDAELRMQLTGWLWADLDLNLADGRYIGLDSGSDYIPLAPRITSQGGLNLLHPGGLEAAIRYRYIADRPANENNTVVARGSFIAHLMFAYRIRKIKVFGQLENITNTEWNEAQFDTESRLFHEATSISELHFTPGNPFNFCVGISFIF